MKRLLKHPWVTVRTGLHKHIPSPTQTQGLVFASWEKTGLPFHFAKSNIQWEQAKRHFQSAALGLSVNLGTTTI